MIRFINIEGNDVGATWDGRPPYIHWFGGQQSTNLIYVHKIAFASDKKSVRVHMDSDTFHFLALDSYDQKIFKRVGQDIINEFEYTDIKQLYDNTRIVRGWEWNGIYLYVLYVAGSSSAVGEVRADFYLDEERFELGADFYGENGPLYVNLSNNEINIPLAIQRAFYDTDIHEEQTDHITLNRKWKELLSNYWDVAANKGSYKSLINSLKWFEWGDRVQLKELWTTDDFGRTVFTDKNLSSILSEQYRTTLQGYKKTTYLALSAARQELVGNQLDSEKNPELEFISSIWSWEELALKMCLLGNFYETYFMPIHLDLIRATIEDVVYTNTIKTIGGAAIEREDFFGRTGTYKCSVHDGDEFILTNIKCQVGDQTMFGMRWSGESYDQMRILGAEPAASTARDQKTFWSQHFGGIGALVPFEVDIQLDKDDFIKHQVLISKNGTYESNVLAGPHFVFYLLFQEEGEQDLVIQFDSAQGKSYIKSLKINIVDVRGQELKVYRLIKNDVCELGNDYSANNYFFTGQPSASLSPIVQYIPGHESSKIGLNRVLILIGDWTRSTYLQERYFISTKRATIDPVTGNSITPITYTCCISKNFWEPEIEPSLVTVPVGFKVKRLTPQEIYRSDWGYFGEFHHLVELGPDHVQSAYEITDDDVLVVVPEFAWGKKISNPEWIFYNATKDKYITLPSVNQPFIADKEEFVLEPGYYDVIFRFVMGDQQHEIRIDSSFIKK